jgi:adenosylcobyric acid synthase
VVRGADLAILPGSKSTAADLAWLRVSGLADVLTARAAAGAPVLGICGGCQMLGDVIDDPERVESPEPHVRGLGLLPLRTRFARTKTTAQVRARARETSFLGVAAGTELTGYEIHMGDARGTTGDAPFEIVARNGEALAIVDGAARGSVVGTMIHGLLDNDAVRAGLLANLRARRGLATPPPGEPIALARAREYDRLADAIDAHLDLDLLWRLSRVRRR